MNAKSFLAGALVGLLCSALGVYVVAVPRVHAAETKAAAAQAELDRRTQAFLEAGKITDDMSRVNAGRMVETQKIIDANTAPSGFTALVEPAPAQPSPLQLFDVLHPGLGTMLAKLQNSQHQNTAVQWVVPGHVKPATNSPGYSYCWLNEKGEVDLDNFRGGPQNCPALGGAQ